MDVRLCGEIGIQLVPAWWCETATGDYRWWYCNVTTSRRFSSPWRWRTDLWYFALEKPYPAPRVHVAGFLYPGHSRPASVLAMHNFIVFRLSDLCELHLGLDESVDILTEQLAQQQIRILYRCRRSTTEPVRADQ